MKLPRWNVIVKVPNVSDRVARDLMHSFIRILNTPTRFRNRCKKWEVKRDLIIRQPLRAILKRSRQGPR